MTQATTQPPRELSAAELALAAGGLSNSLQHAPTRALQNISLPGTSTVPRPGDSRPGS